MVSERVKVHIGLAAALIVFFGSIALLLAGTLYRGDLHAGLPGSVAPDFSLRDADNQPVALSELRGNVVIVYFRGRDVSASAAPTTEPSEVALAELSPSSNRQSILPADGTVTKNDSIALGDASPTIEELSAMARQAHNPRLKVLELDSPASMGNADSLTAAAQASAEGPSQSKSSTDSPVRTLFDLSGDVARKYKIDSGEPKPTVFVIDPSGIIRYRANSLQSDGVSLAGQLLAPATQPSSCPQVVQTLLSSEAVGLSQ